MDLGFAYREKNGDFEIFHRNKKATTLRSDRAREFKLEIENLDFDGQQQLMARLTGNYKRGNERVAKNHLRNRY
jgi:hypothetical protein